MTDPNLPIEETPNGVADVINRVEKQRHTILAYPWRCYGNYVWCEKLFLGKFDWDRLAEHVVQLHNESIKPNPLNTQ